MKIQMEGFQKLQDDLEKVIEKEDSNSSITTDSDEKQEFHNLRERVSFILHTNKFHIIVVALVVLDSLLVIAELLLDMNIIQVSEHKGGSDLAPKILHYSSLAILSVFIVEIFVKLYAFRLSFFRHKMELFDAVVVLVSFILDIIFRNKEGPESGAGLLVVLRLWRVTRILNGIVVSVKKQAEKKIQREKRLRMACEKELSKYREYCTTQEQEIELMKGLLLKHGIDLHESQTQPPEVSKMDIIADINLVAETEKGQPPPPETPPAVEHPDTPDSN
ncbi:voltage-gated hydrogen channel 1-like [Crassostrea virginica]|uniref:Voltage-gated hydrogen channel 1 n=1 Tax=Crassostrea virginica TaxID=6565 RepID=A0A8B8EVE0_CRAVI|nr:voltage-gated hydrogen channel 1-like [Crassostrea virginica]